MGKITTKVPIEYKDGRVDMIEKSQAYNILHARNLTEKQKQFKSTVKTIVIGGERICVHSYRPFEDKKVIRAEKNGEYNSEATHTVDIFSGLECENCDIRIYQSLSKA